MAASDPVVRFRFDFADLKREGPTSLRVLAPVLEPLPRGVVALGPRETQAWLPELLPVFRDAEPLRVGVVDAGAPAWGARVLASLACLFKSAGARANLSCLAWPGGFAVGAPGLARIPVLPHVVVVAAELDADSIASAIRLGRTLDAGRALLVLHGDAPRLETRLGLDAARSAAPVHRLPTLDAADIAALHAGVVRPALGRGCLLVARDIVARYREAEG